MKFGQEVFLSNVLLFQLLMPLCLESIYHIYYGNFHWRPDRRVSPKCPDKEIAQRGEIALYLRKLFVRGMFPVQLCTRLHVKLTDVQHLEFLDTNATKRVGERNTSPLISWTIEKDVKAFTNKQLKMYLKQKGLKIRGAKAELVDLYRRKSSNK